MDGWKYDEVISSAWKCLLLWQISILGGAFEQEESGGGGGMSQLNMCAETINPSRGQISRL